jgi:hypothetical protein
MIKFNYPLALIIIFLNFNLRSQTEKIDNIIPQIGTSIKFIRFQTDNIDLEDKIARSNWNFKELTPVDSTVLHYISPKDTPYHKHFPNANMAMTSDNIEFTYFTFNDSSYCYLGEVSYDVENKKASLTAYSSCKTMMKFPISLNDSIHTTELRYIKYFGRFDVYTVVSSRNLADAEGTLITDKDTIHETVRYKRYSEFHEFMTNYTNYAEQKQTELSYNWFVSGYPAQILSVEFNKQYFKGDTNSYEKISCARGTIIENNKHPFIFYLSLSEDGRKYIFHIDDDHIGKRKVKLEIANEKGESLSKPFKFKLSKNQHTFELDASIIESLQTEGVFIFTLNAGSEKMSLYFVLSETLKDDLFESEFFDRALQYRDKFEAEK